MWDFKIGILIKASHSFKMLASLICLLHHIGRFGAVIAVHAGTAHARVIHIDGIAGCRQLRRFVIKNGDLFCRDASILQAVGDLQDERGMGPDEAVAECVYLDGNPFARFEQGGPGFPGVVQTGEPGDGGIQHLAESAGHQGLVGPYASMVGLDDLARYGGEELDDFRASAPPCRSRCRCSSSLGGSSRCSSRLGGRSRAAAAEAAGLGAAVSLAGIWLHALNRRPPAREPRPTADRRRKARRESEECLAVMLPFHFFFSLSVTTHQESAGSGLSRRSSRSRAARHAVCDLPTRCGQK